ncbi:MAG: TIGR01777 family oxidoreductase [Proteobacteria bacterium]|nr:TIGR01777 family oxidoreductase [Pseudomonadota bacterium]
MEVLLTMFVIQGLIGGIDNLWHHEITEKLSSDPSARNELALHSVRELIYGVIFVSLAWVAWEGIWAYLLVILIVIEVIITLWDFVIEDQTRDLPPSERVLHTILAINFGIILTLFAPIIVGWANASTAFVPVDYGLLSWIMMVIGIGVFGWGVYDLIAVQRLSMPDWKRQPFKRGRREEAKTVLITGATGLIGTALTRQLVERGDQVIVHSRSFAKAYYKFGPQVKIVTSLTEIKASEPVDAFINLAGEPVMGGLWTKRRKEKLISSRIRTICNLIALGARLARPPKVLISASAIGFYGPRGEEELTENDPSSDHFMSELCVKSEERAMTASKLGLRVALMRIGLVLSKKGGAFPQLARPIKFGIGAILGRGDQWMSWVHQEDLVQLFLYVLDHPRVSGPVNAVAPSPVRNRDFFKEAGSALKRPVLLKIPEVFLRLGLGEMADLLIRSQKVLPTRALSWGFEFKFPQLGPALNNLTGKASNLAPTGNDCTLYYNDICPICSAEIDHYKSVCEKQDIEVKFIGVQGPDPELRDYGLTRDDLKRRMYVLGTDGRLKAGTEAFKEIWSQMPQYRWAARAIDNPMIRVLATFAYEGVMAPILYRFSNYLEVRKATQPNRRTKSKQA